MRDIFPSIRLRLYTIGGAILLYFLLSQWIPVKWNFLICWSGVTLLSLYEWCQWGPPMVRVPGFLVIACGALSLLGNYAGQGIKSIILVGILASISDSMAYVAGSFFGGPLLCPSISPNKTWAGAIFGFLTANIFGIWYLWSIKNNILDPSWHSSTFGKGILVVTLGALAAQGGDLLESWAKRKAGKKDSGTILPGHGGMLDRVDSWFAVSCILLFCWILGWRL